MRRSSLARSVLIASCLLSLGLFSCESDPDEGSAPFSEACDECLSRAACSDPWDRCVDDPDCEQYVLCVLRQQCFTEPVGSNCAAEAGCELADSDGEPGTLSREFETCARTECARTCDFMEP